MTDSIRFSGTYRHALCCWLAVPLLFGACSADDSVDASIECHPLETTNVPIALDVLIGAGRDTQGRIYVGDTHNAIARVFVSNGPELVRMSVSGASGASFTVADVRSFELQVEGSRPLLARVTLIEDGQSEVLSHVLSSDFDALPLRNFPGLVQTEYGGQLSDGRILLVIHPTHDWMTEDTRVFFGPADRLAERRLLDFSRGSTTHIEFDLDGTVTAVDFPDQLSEDDSEYFTPALLGQALLPLESSLEEARYFCLPPCREFGRPDTAPI